MDYATSTVPDSNRFHFTLVQYYALYHKLTPKNYNKHTKGWVWLRTYVKHPFKHPYEAERDPTLDRCMDSGLIYTVIFDSPRGKITIMVETQLQYMAHWKSRLLPWEEIWVIVHHFPNGDKWPFITMADTGHIPHCNTPWIF